MGVRRVIGKGEELALGRDHPLLPEEGVGAVCNAALPEEHDVIEAECRLEAPVQEPYVLLCKLKEGLHAREGKGEGEADVGGLVLV